MPEQSYWIRLWRERITRRRLLAGAAAGGAGLAGATLAACGGKVAILPSTSSSGGQAAAAGPPQQGGTVNVYYKANMPLDPQKVSANPQRAVGGVYSRILRFKTGLDAKTIEDHGVENDLAASLEVPDASTWTIKLRPDVKFQNIAPINGRAFGAEDVKATFTRAVDPATASPNRGTLSMIDPSQIQTPDDHTITFKLAYPYGPFSRILASAVYSWILPREVLTGAYDPSKQVIGTGPYLLDAATPDVAYTYKRNPDWFEQGLPHTDAVKIAIITDSNTQLAQFSGGNLDELVVDNPFSLDTVKRQNPKATIQQIDYSSASPLYFQLGDPTSQFLDIRVRRAFSMAIDREAITKSVYNGQADTQVYVPGYMGKWCLWVKDLPASLQPYYQYNPAEAKKLLQAAGATNLQLQVGYSAPGTPASLSTVQILANGLNAVGVKTVLAPYDYNKDFVDSGHGIRQGFFPKDYIGFLGIAPYEDPDFWLFTYFHSKSTENQERLNDPKMDAMIDHERTLINDDERLKAVRDALTYLAEQMYVVPTPGGPEWVAVQPRVQNYQWSSTIGIVTETYAKLWLKD
jgi:peptide/nickel transport system substrate-binding protein